MAVVAQDLIERLRRLEVSTLCDADKTLPVVDGAVHAIVANARMVGVARTAVAEDDHLSVITALAGAGPDDVLVVTTNGHVRAVLGELLAHEAHRRGLAGIVIAPPARIAAALDAAEDRAVAEQAMLAAIRGGASYHDLSGFADHLARLDRGEDSRLEFRAHGG